MNLIVLEEPGEKWDEFVFSHSDLVFHTSLWWKVLKEGYGCGMRYLVFEEEGYWLSALPGMMVGNRFFEVFYSLIPYGGFIGDREHIPEFLSLLNNWAKKEKIHRIQIVDLDIKKKQDLPDFNCVESYRHVLKLKDKSPDLIWKDYKDSLKRNIKTAFNSDLCFEKIKSREEVDQFYRLYLASMKRIQTLAKYPIQLFYKIYDLLVPEFSDMFFVKYHSQPVAAMVVIYSEKTAHYFHGGSAMEYLHLRPNDLLFHNAIKIAKDKGRSYFDFMGSSKKMLGLIQFKEKWGAERKIVFNYHQDINKSRSAIYQLLLPIVNFLRGKK